MADLSAEVHEAHRLIRVLPPGEGPFEGALVDADDRICVAIPVARLVGWQGWRFAGAEHIAAPIDLALGLEGDVALLPWCRDRLSAVLARRAVTQEALRPGEAGTIVISLLRGCGELGDELTRATGEWWVTDSGRPVFVCGSGRPADDATGQVLSDIAAAVSDRGMLRIITELVASWEQPRSVVRDRARWERDLLECAAPQPVASALTGPGTAGDSAEASRFVRAGLIPTRGSEGADRTRARSERSPRASDPAAPVLLRRDRRRDRMPWHDRLAAHLDTLRTRLTGLTRRPPESRGVAAAGQKRPRAPLLVGAFAAAAVLVGGIMWPASATEPASRAPASDTAVSDPQVVGETAEEVPGAPAEREGSAGGAPSNPARGTEPTAAVSALRAVAQDCVGRADAACPGAVAEGHFVDVGLLARQDADSVTLVDDYGDVAVVELAATAHAHALLVVVTRRNDLWLLRDLYEVAEQPE